MQKFIKSSLDYIEQNLKTDITAEELAKMANYSVWHYYRLFNETTGSSVANYIVKRRLDHALAEISLGRKAIDVVLEYGFDTYAGFYKAFVKMYGCSPRKYLSIYKNHTPKTEVLLMANIYNEKDLRKILENWDIPQNLKIEDVSEYDWKRWKVGDYYLTTNERDKMIRNIKIAKALNKQGLSSMFLPIPIKSGGDYLDGENIFILAQKKGEPYHSDGSTIMTREKLLNYGIKTGQGVAKLHKAFKSVQDDVKPDDVNIYKLVMEWAMPETKKYIQKYNMNISEEFFDDYIKNFSVIYPKLPKQFIHRNPHGGNILFENGEVTSIIGFEYYNEYNVRIFDVLYAAGELNTKPLEYELSNTIDEYLTVLKGILKGYDSVNPLTEEEKQSIFYVSFSTAMIFIAYLDETQEVAKRNREALILLLENKEKFYNLI